MEWDLGTPEDSRGPGIPFSIRDASDFRSRIASRPAELRFLHFPQESLRRRHISQKLGQTVQLHREAACQADCLCENDQ